MRSLVIGRLAAGLLCGLVVLCAGLNVEAARADEEASGGGGMTAARVARDTAQGARGGARDGRDTERIPADSLLMVAATVTPDTGTVGDRLVLTLTAVHDLDTALAFPKLVGEIAPFEVIDVVIYPTDETPEGAVVRRDIVITSFETGEHTIPELAFHTIVPGGDTAVVYTNPLEVVIHSVIPPEDLEGQPEPRDIKPPLDLPRAVWPWIIAAVAAGALAVAWRIWRRWRATRPEREEQAGPTREERRRAAHLVAQKRLGELRAADHLGRADIEAFYVELTDIARRYIGDRFGVPAIDRTTVELRPELAEAARPEEEISWLTRLLERADLSKFARSAPTVEQGEGDLRDVEEYVERTRLRSVHEEGDGSADDKGDGSVDDRSDGSTDEGGDDVPVR